ncbi:hypothetical protein [Dyadobacter sp. CY356]|uniref:hypothetical protein n=1 Tax=Dyadobacter sp. CY356 TaxID=2906442 RepID=UPI001F1A9E42|nr:hypothetical protein [Dyadobacter sp. CY356]MCF0059161.1 hypothetical protein [Dyadobacter sp. CY356]
MRFLYWLIFITVVINFRCFAQRNADQDIQDSVIGWWNNNRFDHLKPQTDAIGKSKEVIVNDMVRWMKASYTPVGGLGTSSRYIGSRGYGVNFLVWNVSHDKLWTEPNGNFKPIPEENTKFAMAANQLFGAFPISFINTANQFYFTIQPEGYADNDQLMAWRKGADPRIHPNAYKYITWVNDWCTVYLAPDNKLPWIPVSKGELLQKAEEGLLKVLADKRKQVASQWPDNKKNQDEALDYFEKGDLAKYRNKISELKKRHANTLNEPALLSSMQTTMYSFETDPDIFRIDDFAKNLNQAFPVYKLDSAALARIRDIKPLWVAVAFPYENKERGNQKYELFTAMSENINYDYIYNYFYEPEKIKGQSYIPSNAAGLKARLDSYRSKSSGTQKLITKKQTNLPANIALFDDFSQDKVGEKPAGWYFNSVGKKHVIAKIEGESGNWLKLGYSNELTSITLQTFPENFSLEYDLVTSGFDGRWGANLTVELKGSKKGSDGVTYSSNLTTSITAGNQSALDSKHDYRGELKIDLLNSPSKMDYNDKGGYFADSQPVFTSTKRKVHVQLLKKDTLIALFLNGKEVTNSMQFKTRYGKPCGDCSIPAGMVYNSFVIRNFTQEPDAVACYIGNVVVSKI